MPPENDENRCDLLARLLLSSVGEVVFDERAYTGSRAGPAGLDEPDDLGLRRVLSGKLTPLGMKQKLLTALVRELQAGRRPDRVEVPGDREYQKDAELRYEFRFVLGGVRVYVKTVFCEDDPKDPLLIIKCVKRWN